MVQKSYKNGFLKATLILGVLIVWSVNAGHAQRVIFRRDVRDQIKRVYADSTGPNGSSFTHTILGVGLILPINESDSASITENTKSNQIYLGFREKLKISENISFTIDLTYLRQKFNIKQHELSNIFSPAKKNQIQKLNTNAVGLGLALRMNFGKRGNIMGKYLDLGGDAQYVFASRILTKNKTDATSSGGAEKSINSLHNLDYVSPFLLFANVRFGFNHFAVFTKYRLNDQFKKSDNFYAIGKIPELPRISIGLEIGLYR